MAADARLQDRPHFFFEEFQAVLGVVAAGVCARSGQKGEYRQNH
jgi:hypothetical protein